jgi:hypothetical protein
MSDGESKFSGRGLQLAQARSIAAGKGGPNAVAEDLFQRVSGIGGVLVVAMVAPIPAKNGSAFRTQAISAVAQKAKERDEDDREKMQVVVTALKEQQKVLEAQSARSIGAQAKRSKAAKKKRVKR